MKCVKPPGGAYLDFNNYSFFCLVHILICYTATEKYSLIMNYSIYSIYFPR